MAINFFTFGENQSIDFTEDVDINFDFTNKRIVMVPKGGIEMRCFSVGIDAIFIKDKKFICSFSNETLAFICACVFADENACVKYFDMIQLNATNHADERDKSNLVQDSFLSPLLHRARNQLSTITQIVSQIQNSFHPTSDDETVASSSKPRRSKRIVHCANEGSVGGNIAKATSKAKKAKVSFGGQNIEAPNYFITNLSANGEIKSRLYIVDTNDKKLAYEYGVMNSKTKLYYCCECRKISQSKNVSAQIQTKNGVQIVAMNEEVHVCQPKEYDPSLNPHL